MTTGVAFSRSTVRVIFGGLPSSTDKRHVHWRVAEVRDRSTHQLRRRSRSPTTANGQRSRRADGREHAQRRRLGSPARSAPAPRCTRSRAAPSPILRSESRAGRRCRRRRRRARVPAAHWTSHPRLRRGAKESDWPRPARGELGAANPILSHPRRRRGRLVATRCRSSCTAATRGGDASTCARCRAEELGDGAARDLVRRSAGALRAGDCTQDEPAMFTEICARERCPFAVVGEADWPTTLSLRWMTITPGGTPVDLPFVRAVRHAAENAPRR